MGRPCLHSTWCLLGLESLRCWIPAHGWSLRHLLPCDFFIWLLWAFSQHRLGVVELRTWWWIPEVVTGFWRCQQRKPLGHLKTYAWNWHNVIFTRFFRPKASHRPVQIQAEETVQGVDTGKSGLLGPPRNIPLHEPSIFLKGKKVTFLFCLLFTDQFMHFIIY